MSARKTAIALRDYSEVLTNEERRCYLEDILAIPSIVDGKHIRRSARLAKIQRRDKNNTGSREMRSACRYTSIECRI